MVVLLDLDEDVLDDPPNDAYSAHAYLGQQYHRGVMDPTDAANDGRGDDRPNPNINGFSAILSCYPIVTQLASLIDLNTLHNLSRTCRQFRANLLEYRNQIVSRTLHCCNEEVPAGPRLGLRLAEMRGKIGQCARDMVGDCRNCGLVVCRNCTCKPPRSDTLPGRLRRVCKTCATAPLSRLTASTLLNSPSPPTSAVSTPRSSPHASPSTSPPQFTSPHTPPSAFTSSAFRRDPCCCPDSVYLCQPCGHALRTADQTYMLGWTWRSRYSTYLDGLGTGIGEGHEGVKCGLGAHCLGGRYIEHEIECSADDSDSSTGGVGRGSGGSTPTVAATGEASRYHGTSYFSQEIEGIGGRVVKKAKKRVRVGAVVKEYEDEREGGVYLKREREGENRAWCAWCARVVPSKKDQ
ncbi:hypothetical protein K490DRAFT_23186, partial [Saccharata proteae CBS 121410]